MPDPRPVATVKQGRRLRFSYVWIAPIIAAVVGGYLFYKSEIDVGPVDNPESPEDYAMDHSTSVLVLDPHARYHAIVSPPYTVDGVVENWRKMATYFEAKH
jgi:hypothetical protein